VNDLNPADGLPEEQGFITSIQATWTLRAIRIVPRCNPGGEGGGHGDQAHHREACQQVGGQRTACVVQVSDAMPQNCPSPSTASPELPINVVALGVLPLISSLGVVFKLGRCGFLRLDAQEKGIAAERASNDHINKGWRS